MLKNCRKNLIILSIIVILYWNTYFVQINCLDLYDYNLRTSQMTGKVRISENNGWIDYETAGHCSGSGTLADPYVIDGLVLNGQGYDAGLYIEGSDVYFTIINSIIYSSEEALRLQNVQNGKVINSEFYYSQVGVFLDPNCKDNIVQNNSIHDNSIGVYLLQSISNHVKENNIRNCDNTGIYLDDADNNIIRDNLIRYFDTGIKIDNANNNQIIENILSNGVNGIDSWMMSNNQILRNTIKDNQVGINIGGGCTCNTISDNFLTGNWNDIIGEQEECPNPFPFPFPLIIGISVGLGILIISIFIVRKKRRARKKELIEVREKPITLKSEDIKSLTPLPTEEIFSETPIKAIEKPEIPPVTAKVEKIEVQEMSIEEGIHPVVPIIEDSEKELQPEVQEVAEEVEIMESFCPNCGRQINSSWKFCPDCKTKIIEEIPGVISETEEILPEEEIIEEVKESIDENAITEEEAKEIVIEDQELGKEPIKEPIVEENTEEHIVEEEELVEEMVTEPVGPTGQLCSNCGKQIKDTWRICPYCRFRLKEEELKPVIEELSPIPEEEVSQPVESKKIESEVPHDEIKPEVEEFEPTEVVELPEYKVEGPSIQKPSSTHKIVEDESWRERIKRAAPEDFEKIEVKFCTNCGKQLQPTWNICPYCRFRIKKEELEVVVPKREAVSALREAMQKPQPTPTPIIKKKEEIQEPEFAVREFPKEPIKLITQEEYEVERKHEIPQETIKPKVSIPSKPIEEPKLTPKPEMIVKKFPKEPSKVIPPKPIEEIKPTPPPEPPKPKENICPFCGLKNELEKNTCIRCGYKLKK